MMPALKVTFVGEELDRENFAEARRLSTLSQRELGKRVGVHGNYINRLENGDLESVPSDLIDQCIAEMSKEGAFKGQRRAKDLVRKVLRGEVKGVLSFQPSLVGTEGDGATSERQVDTLYSRHWADEQGFRDLVAVGQ